MPDIVQPVSIDDIRAARERIASVALATPCVRLNSGSAGAVHLKLENLQPVASFQMRPLANAMLSRSRAELARGVHTASSGNAAIAMSWMARHLGIPATAIVADGAPPVKLDQIRRLGAKIVSQDFATWWRNVCAADFPGVPGIYVDAARDPAALSGNGTIGLEILEQIPDVEAIFAPVGSGAMASGIACAMRALKPDVKVIGAELESAQPMTAAMRAGGPVERPYETGFVTGVGFGSILPEMWPLAKQMLDGTLTVSLDEVAAAIRLIAAKCKCIAEGAGAIPVAAAMSGRHPYRNVCAVVSGGNIDPKTLVSILGRQE
jgi:threonine dehydratase